MKKKDLILISAVLLLALAVWGGTTLWQQHESGTRLKITIDGEIYGFYSLAKDQTITIGSTNVCQIKAGQVTMIEADCPDHLCLSQKAISIVAKGTIICLPNRIVLEISS